ncbi:GNAT family N-acetyltransferase [Mesorhizobium sp. Z1-4]|uniref:GNAT family N-acetyltransferase n=1 Tax=Mesorhizobium sp. Z1-4 TaxID=2448478 RepID=UPI000FDB7D7B|nr:GNAT family N-acetyltransferase [Mesorhizobium sp. Z1-4]
MRPDAGAISFKPVTAGDYGLLREWLNRPHMREWWGEPETELGYIVDMVEGRDTTRPFLIMLGGEPVGYIQYWFVGHHQDEQWLNESPWLTELPKETVGVDLSIGDPDRLSAGIGTAALTAFVAMLRAEGFHEIIIDPDPDNRRAVRAYEKAGFLPIPELEGRTDDVLLMRYAQKPNETHI